MIYTVEIDYGNRFEFDNGLTAINMAELMLNHYSGDYEREKVTITITKSDEEETEDVSI